MGLIYAVILHLDNHEIAKHRILINKYQHYFLFFLFFADSTASATTGLFSKRLA